MGERDAGIIRRCHDGRNAGDDLERNFFCHERLGFFAAAPKNKRVAALEPNDAQAASAPIDQQRADFFLRVSVVRFLLADIETFRPRRREIEKVRARKVVVENRIGLSEKTPGLERNQFRIARPGTHQVDLVHTGP